MRRNRSGRLVIQEDEEILDDEIEEEEEEEEDEIYLEKYFKDNKRVVIEVEDEDGMPEYEVEEYDFIDDEWVEDEDSEIEFDNLEDAKVDFMRRVHDLGGYTAKKRLSERRKAGIHDDVWNVANRVTDVETFVKKIARDLSDEMVDLEIAIDNGNTEVGIQIVRRVKKIAREAEKLAKLF
jgi:hypothetical protein